jgi:hypothetical protein
MIEIKSVIVDVGSLAGGIDRKVRIARAMARDRGWDVTAVVPALLILEGSTARRRVAAYAAMFGRLELRGQAALRWLRQPPARGPHPRGALCFTTLSGDGSGDRRRAGRQRVRRITARAR